MPTDSRRRRTVPPSPTSLGPHSPLALYLAIATAVTVFIIALAYNQVIELFPSGGGGYKVARSSWVRTPASSPARR